MRSILLAGLGLAQAALWIAGLPSGAGAAELAWGAVVLFALQLASLRLSWHRTDRATLAIVLFFALVFRAAAWTWPPDLSSDLYRYVWDGRVQLWGESPYRWAPSAPALEELRDDAIWPHINRPDARTVYPPGAEIAFLALALAGGDSIRVVKTAAMLADLAVLWLLVAALRRRDLPAGRVAIYAWSPLVVSEVCVSGHVDALAMLGIVAALSLLDRVRGKRLPSGTTHEPGGSRGVAAAGALLGAAAAVKLYPILLLAAFPRGRPRMVGTAAAAGVVGLAYLAYAIPVGPKVLGFLPDYVRSGEDFNAGLRAAVEWLLSPTGAAARPVAMILCAAMQVVAIVWVARRGTEDPFRAAAWIALAFIMLLPTAVHPWYALWLVPPLAVHRSEAGLWLVGALPLSYLKYGAPGEQMPVWVLVAEWLPAFALLVHELLANRATEPYQSLSRSPRTEPGGRGGSRC